MRKQKLCVIGLAAFLFGIFLSISYVNPYTGEITLSELILQLSGSRGEFALAFSLNELLGFSMRMIPGWILEAALGIEMYHHFCTASVYVFSRCVDRKKWCWKEMGILGADIILFELIVTISVIIISSIRIQIKPDLAGCVLTVYHILIEFLWIYIMTVIINLLALKLGSSQAFTMTIFLQALCIGLLSLEHMADRQGGNIAKVLLIKCNPIAHLVLGWHGSYIAEVDRTLKYSIGIPCESFYAEVSLICLVIMAAMISKIGSVVLGKHDLIISDAEMGVS